ncbi:hypothetical protein, partial [Burkholderia cenocepacia]|uniref:hypothetical protein n=1 Tax=Burkholderia cenocepacia TaxID=95486 RepID=UPI002011F798
VFGTLHFGGSPVGELVLETRFSRIPREPPPSTFNYARDIAGMNARLIQGHLLRLSFADVDFLNPNLSKRPRDKLARTLTAEQAQAIHSFAEALPIEIVSMVIHCEGGHHGHAPSPWRAIGYMAIRRIVHLSHANPAIVRIMIGNDRTTHRERQRARD